MRQLVAVAKTGRFFLQRLQVGAEKVEIATGFLFIAGNKDSIDRPGQTGQFVVKGPRKDNDDKSVVPSVIARPGANRQAILCTAALVPGNVKETGYPGSRLRPTDERFGLQ
jgi:hypothetical protein